MKYPAWVYALTNDVTGRTYVGITSNPSRRKSAHLSALKRKAHTVEDLQADYDKYGAVFSFRILEYVPVRATRNAEFAWSMKLRTYEREYGYNYKDPTAHLFVELSRRNHSIPQLTSQKGVDRG